MIVYIAYDRYEYNEWFLVYNIETNKKRAIKHYKEIDLPNFLSSYPDDCHSFQLQKIEMSKKEYTLLCELVKNVDIDDCTSEESNMLRDIMISIYEKCDWENPNILFATDGIDN